MAGIKPPRVKFGASSLSGGGFDDLKQAVAEHCQRHWRESHGRDLTPDDFSFLRQDPELLAAAHKDARDQLDRARPHFETVKREMETVESLEKRGIVSDEAAFFAKKILTWADGFLSSEPIRPSRGDWLGFRVLRWLEFDGLSLEALSRDDLACLSLFSGWWPEKVTAQSVNEAGVTLAGVWEKERKAMHTARLRWQAQRKALHEPIQNTP